MKIVFFSDSHALHRKLVLPEGDVLVFCGDMCNAIGYSLSDCIKNVRDMDVWFGEQSFEKVICIAGNHDEVFEKSIISKMSNAIYLEDTSYEYKGVKFFGSPWTLPFFGSFSADESRLKTIYDKIDSVDVLITHGPPYSILDEVRGKYTGSRYLLDLVNRVKPKVHAFGHIHNQYGIKKINDTTFINCSTAGLLKKEAFVIEI